MRIAVLSDIHGFDLAFQAVLEDIDANGPFDTIVAAGDLCEMGPRPDEVVRTIQKRGIDAVMGNTDRDLIEAARFGTSSRELQYGVSRLGEDGIAFLEALPFELRLSPPTSSGPKDDLLVVHANPRNMEDPLDPHLTDEELLSRIGPTQAAAIAFGHIHISYIRQVGPHLLVDVSAVGNPKDGELSSRYGVLNWNESTKQWSAEIRRVPYPLVETEAEIRASEMHAPKKVIRKLSQASYRGR